MKKPKEKKNIKCEGGLPTSTTPTLPHYLLSQFERTGWKKIWIETRVLSPKLFIYTLFGCCGAIIIASSPLAQRPFFLEWMFFGFFFSFKWIIIPVAYSFYMFF